MTDYSRDPFFQYATTVFETSEGPFTLPMFFYETEMFFAVFVVDRARAQEITGAEDLDAVDIGQGKALAAIACYNYKNCSIKPYKEVGLAIASVPKGAKAPDDPMATMLGDPDASHMAFYVANLPVTTQQAVAAGIEAWGFPKFLAQIDYRLDGNRFDCSTANPDGSGAIFRLSGEAGPGVPAPSMQTAYFTRLDGKTLRLHGITRGQTRACLPGSLKLEVQASDHPMARNLRHLGLNGASPDQVIFAPQIQIRLTAGSVLP